MAPDEPLVPVRAPELAEERRHLARGPGPHKVRTPPAQSLRKSTLTLFKLRPDAGQHDHDVLREGSRLGVVVATVTWFWLALIDALSGDPLRTTTMLGGVVPFTLAHYVLNIVYALSLVSLIHGATRYPSLILVALIGFAMIEIGFIMLTAALSYFLGGIAWVSIFGGSVVGAAIAFLLLALTHPLGALLHKAETER